MKEEFDYKFDLLLKEMEFLQAGIRSYDAILFKIKGWAITIFSGFTFFVVRENKPIYLAIAAIIVVLFWTIDALNKSFQRIYIVRYNKIEHFLRKDFTKAFEKKSLKDFNIPDIAGRVSVNPTDRQQKISPLRGAFYPHTSLLYLVMLAVLLMMWFGLN